MAHTKEEIRGFVKKHYPIANSEGTSLFEKIVEVCFHAGYYEQDIDELCSSLSDFSDSAFQRGIATKM